MFNYDALNIALYRILAEEIPDAKNSELLRLANKLGQAAVEKMPKHGDFWLNEDDGVLYVNKGWGRVTVEGLDGPESKALQALDNLYNDNNEGMKTLAAMKPKIRVILEMAIEQGVRRGYRRAHKHVENPTEESICEHIEECVMGEIYEVFSFSDEE